MIIGRQRLRLWFSQVFLPNFVGHAIEECFSVRVGLAGGYDFYNPISCFRGHFLGFQTAFPYKISRNHGHDVAIPPERFLAVGGKPQKEFLEGIAAWVRLFCHHSDNDIIAAARIQPLTCSPPEAQMQPNRRVRANGHLRPCQAVRLATLNSDFHPA